MTCKGEILRSRKLACLFLNPACTCVRVVSIYSCSVAPGSARACTGAHNYDTPMPEPRGRTSSAAVRGLGPHIGGGGGEQCGAGCSCHLPCRAQLKLNTLKQQLQATGKIE